MRKKLLAMLLILVMVLTMSPMTAFADLATNPSEGSDDAASTAQHGYLSELSLTRSNSSAQNIYSYNPKTGELGEFSFSADTTEYTVAFPELAGVLGMTYTPTTTATLDNKYKNDSELTLTGAWSTSANPTTTPELGQTMTPYSGGKATIEATKFRSFFTATTSTVANNPLKLYYLTGVAATNGKTLEFSETDVYTFNFYRILALAAAPTVKDGEGNTIATDAAKVLDPYKTEYNITVPKSTKSLSVTAKAVTPASTDVQFDNGKSGYIEAASDVYTLTLADYGESYKQSDGSLVIPFTLKAKDTCKGGVDGHYTLKVNFEESAEITAESTASVKASELKSWKPVYSAKDKDGKDATEQVALKYYQGDGTTELADMNAVADYIGDAKTNSTFVVALSLEGADSVEITVTVLPESEPAKENDYIANIKLLTSDEHELFDMSKAQAADDGSYSLDIAYPGVIYKQYTMPLTLTDSAKLNASNLRISATLANESGEIIRKSSADGQGYMFYQPLDYVTDLTGFNYYNKETSTGTISKSNDFFYDLELGTYNFTVKVFDKDNNELCDERTVKLTLVPYLSSLSVFDGARQLQTSPDISSQYNNTTQSIVKYTREYNVTVPSGITEITLKGTATAWRTQDGEPMGYIYYGGEQQAAADNGFPYRKDSYTWFDDEGITIDLTGCQSSDDEYIIPFSLVWGELASGIKSDYTLYVTKGASSSWEITSQPQGGTYNKGDSVELSVSVTGDDKDKVSYQWQWAPNSLNDNAYGNIEGATESTFKPPTAVGGSRSYRCIVTDTNNIKQKSSAVEVNVNLGKVNDPEIVIQPGTYSNLDVAGDTTEYQKTYKEGQSISALQIAAGSAEVTDMQNSKGAVKMEFVWYENSDNSYVGAKVIDSENYTIGSNGRAGSVDSVGNKVLGVISNCNITEKLSVGTHYYFCEVTAVAIDDETNKSSTIRSKILPITIQPRGEIDGFEGTGTEENPYLIRTVDHLKKIKALVEGGDSLNGAIFKLANDITLPGDWEPIGKNNGGSGKYLLAFSGTIDGGNHTIEIAEGGKPLLNYARDAVVKNLKIHGEDINGAALLNSTCVDYGTDGVYQQYTDPDIITVENVTLLSGSKTRGSGLVNGGYTSGINDIIIRNCTIENNVVVGWKKDQSAIGSFVGTLNGRIEDSVSYATVYGVRNVGGLAGKKGQSMGDCTIINSEFLGSIEATGGCVGGILGSGYISASAPNTPPVSIQNCFVAAEITGNSKEFISGGENLGSGIGGIIGSEYGIRAAWNDASISDNHFYGTIHDTNSTDTYAHVGGIIGELGAYDATHQSYTNNYYLASNNYKGLGSMVISASGWNAEKAFEEKSTSEFADGTVMNLLNKGTLKNWIQRAEEASGDSPYPIHSDVVYVREVTISGDYKTEYLTGDSFSTQGMTVTARFSDGSRKIIELSDPALKFTGYNMSQRGVQTVTVTYDIVKTTYEIRVLYNESQIKEVVAYFTLLGDSSHDAAANAGGPHTLSSGNLKTWVARTKVTINNNTSVFDVFEKVLAQNNIKWKGNDTNQYGTMYISGVQIPNSQTYLEEFTNGPNSGWMYTLNGKHPNLGVAQQFLNNGDEIVFHYTDDWTKESDTKGWSTTTEESKTVTTDTKTGTVTTPTETKVTEKTNADGTKEKTVAVTVSTDNQTEIIKQATDKKSTEIVLEVASTATGGAQNVQLQLNVSFVKNVSEKTDAALTVNTENGTVSLDQDTIKTVLGEAKGATITLDVNKVANPTEIQKKAAGESGQILSLTVKSGDKTISDFKTGKVTVTVAISTALQNKRVAAIHIAEDGKIEQMPGKSREVNGKKCYEFTTSHFSDFALVDADELGLETEDEIDAAALVAKLTPVARSAKTAKGYIKVTTSLDKNDKAIISELADAGYTVKYRFYRSTKKSANYKSAITKKATTYTNTTGKKGTKYFYKVQVRVYDESGKVVAKTALKQCRYACRTWSK